MPNIRKRISAAFAATALGAASLGATPAPAQTGGDDGYGGPGDPCSPWGGGGISGLECCYYPGDGWYYYYNVVGGPRCPYYQSPDEPADRPQDEPAGSSGQ